jgi:anti-anti-sigma factor
MKMARSKLIHNDGDPPMAAFIHEETAHADILHVLGEVDLANADEFGAAISTAQQKGGDVIVDLSACTYMDSSGLRVIATAYKSIEERLRLVVPNGGSVHRIFEIAGLSKQFNACRSVDEALRTPESQTPPTR